MATSGSINFTMNRNEIIQDAAEEIGIAIDGEALDPSFIGVAERTLNRMVKAWMAHGLHLWKRDEVSITLTASTGVYTLGTGGTVASSTRPLKILEAFRKNTDDITVPLTGMSLNEYVALTNREIEGTPVNYYYDPDLPTGTLKLWPVPDTSAAAEYTVELVYQSPLEDFDDSTDEPDFPQEWIEAIVYGLARRLARKYGSLDKYELSDLKQQARESLELALTWDVEDESIYFQPNTERT